MTPRPQQRSLQRPARSSATRLVTALATGVVLATTATACSSPTTVDDDSSAAEAPATTDGPATPTVPPGAGGVAGPDEPIDPTAEPSPTWDADARAAALEHATATMTAFARPAAGPSPGQSTEQLAEQWWAGLAPLLTVSGQQAYAAVDPAEVPPQQVTGEAVLVDDTSAWLARVRVPTDVGDYTLLLVRADAADPDDPSADLWATETITPPAALSQPAGR